MTKNSLNRDIYKPRLQSLHVSEPSFHKFFWPPVIPELGDVVKKYIDEQKPLSIADNSGIYDELESKLKKIFNTKHCLLVSSGTIGLYSVFYSLDLKEDDEVINTVYSYHATASPLLHFNAKIVYCDVEEDTGNIDAYEIEKHISSKTKAIVSNDMWGHPCDKDNITKLCKKYNILYIEDCSHAHFSEYKSKFTGTFGAASVFSLQGNKLLSGGEGGVILTDSDEIFEKCVLLGHNLKRPQYDVKNIFYNKILRTGFGLKFRMHPISAVIINYILDNYCFDWIHSRRKVLDYFAAGINSIPNMKAPVIKDYVTSMGAYYGFKPFVAFDSMKINKSEFLEICKSFHLDVSEPGSKPFYHYDLFLSPEKYTGYKHKTNINDNFEKAERYYINRVSIPTFTFDDDLSTVDYYINVFEKISKEYF